MRSNRLLTNRGFSLVELLTVIAISVVLIGLLLVPLYKSFELVRSAQSLVDAQDGARRGIGLIARDFGEAMYVFNNVDTVTLPVRALDGTVTISALANARVDMILPEMIVHCNNPAHGAAPRDFSRRDARFPNLALALPPCLVCGSRDVEIRPKLPLKQDATIIRYFLGLRNNNPALGWKSWDLGNRTPGAPNPVVLYRVEFDPNNANFANYRDNGFFYDENNAADGTPYWQHWARIATPVSSTKYQDLITAEYVGGIATPGSITPTVQFRFAGVDNVQFVGNSPKTDTGLPISSTVFRAPDGYWSTLTSVSVYRSDGVTAFTAMPDATGRVCVYKDTRPDINTSEWVRDADPQFDVTEYMTSWNIATAGGGDAEMAFYHNVNKGQVNFALRPQPISDPWHPPFPDSNDPPVPAHVCAPSSCVSPICPHVINTRNRRARLATFDPASPNYLVKASVVLSSVNVYVAEDALDGSGPQWVRYQLAPEGRFRTGPREFWIDNEGWITFGDEVPVALAPDGSVLPVRVDYDVQYNRAGDVVVGSYVTKSRMQVAMGMKVYDALSRRPSLFSLTEVVSVGNALR